VNAAKPLIPEENKIATPSPKTSQSPSDKISSSISKEEMKKDSKDNSNVNPSMNANQKPAMSSSGFVLQAGYFGSKVNAEKMDNDLKSKGVTAFRIESVDKDGTMYYRIISKVYNSESNATAEQGHFATIGIKTAVKQL
jgi:cell division protein FtsN